VGAAAASPIVVIQMPPEVNGRAVHALAVAQGAYCRPDGQSIPGGLVLVGQPNLRDLLRLSTNQAFFQRLAVRYHLPPLDLQNCIAYIKHHLQLAGHHGAPLFADDAMTRIFDYTKGIPRQINLVCTTALLSGMIDKKEVIDEATIRKVGTDMDRN